MKRLPIIVLLALSIGFAWLFYARYWKWRDCIAEAASSCMTPDGETLIEGGAIWSVPAIACLLAALVLAWRMR